MATPGKTRWLRLTVLAIAIASVLFVAAGASLWHFDAPGAEASCPICHLAHLPALRGIAAGSLSAPAAFERFVPAGTQLFRLTQVTLDSPSRAPPA